MITRLGDPHLTLEGAGRKAFALNCMISEGFPVPAGFVVLPNKTLNSDVLQEAILAIGGYPVAVRSSACLEDLQGASFAGQYHTFLNIQSIEEVMEKIKLCRASAESPQVKSYLVNRGLGHLDSRVSVLVQKMVPVRWAGVAFSIHPLTGVEDHALIEFCNGLGEKLVSGHISPAQRVVDYRTLKVVDRIEGEISEDLPKPLLDQLVTRVLDIQSFFRCPQDIEWAIDQDGALHILQSRPITQIRHRNDVDEFTNADFRDGGVSARVCTPLMFSLYREVMQTTLPNYMRSIKLLPKRGMENGESEIWIDFFYGRPYWNVSAVKRAMLKIPGFDERALDADLGIQKNYGKKGPIRVRTTFRTILPAIPTALALYQEFNQCLKRAALFRGWFNDQETELLKQSASLALLSDFEFFHQFEKLFKDFYLRVESSYFSTIYNNANAQMEFKSFLAKMDKALGRPSQVVKLIGGLASVSHMELQRDIIDLYQVAEQSGSSSHCFQNALRDFISLNYFHGEAELELSTPRWGEEPGRVTRIIEGMLRTGVKPSSPDISILRQINEYQKEVAEIEERLSHSVWVRTAYRRKFHRHLKRVRTFLALREEMREYSSKTYAFVRIFLLEAARRWTEMGILKSQEEIFLLHLEEILEISRKSYALPKDRFPWPRETPAFERKCAEREEEESVEKTGASPLRAVRIFSTGSDEFIDSTGLSKRGFPAARGLELAVSFRGELKYREQKYRGFSEFVAPNEFGRGIETLQSEDSSRPSSNFLVSHPTLQGLGCSAGITEGRVRRLDSIDQMGEVQPGEILVTRFTDPGWTPVLGIVRGVVTEVGGMLSHAAVIGREYGIPAVLSLKNATSILETGKKIRIDGSLGTVQILDEDPLLQPEQPKFPSLPTAAINP